MVYPQPRREMVAMPTENKPQVPGFVGPGKAMRGGRFFTTAGEEL